MGGAKLKLFELRWRAGYAEFSMLGIRSLSDRTNMVKLFELGFFGITHLSPILELSKQ